MIRRNINFTDDSFNYLNSLPGKFVEHIRWAVEEYIHKRRQEEVRLARNASASQSQRKGGDDNG